MKIFYHTGILTEFVVLMKLNKQMPPDSKIAHELLSLALKQVVVGEDGELYVEDK